MAVMSDFTTIEQAFEVARRRASIGQYQEARLLRQAVHAAYMAGMSVRETAAKLRVPKSTVARNLRPSLGPLTPPSWGTPEEYMEAEQAIWAHAPERIPAGAPFRWTDADDGGHSVSVVAVGAINRKRIKTEREESPMSSLNNLIVRAQEVGQYAADLAHASEGAPASTVGDAHHPGDDTGRLVLEAYRTYGAEEMLAVVRGYQGGYNARAADFGDYVVRWPEIANGIEWALPGATDEEARAIIEAIKPQPLD